MIHKRFLCTGLITLLVLWGAAAGGKKDITERQAENMNSWQESFDISDKKPGTYNIMVTAEDAGGNQSIAGPYNIRIDPDSDLPVTGITNPSPDMRIPGNLNVVGICVDDDAVDYVELVFDGRTDAPVRAEGSDFWSYYLDTTELEEGTHTIEAWGVDINGVRGKPVTVTWHLDRRQPVTAVESHGLGQLVSGKITLTGQVTDGNGIQSLEYSLDGGTFTPVKLKLDKATGSGAFSVPIDTRQLADGAAVCWFKAVDRQGTAGISSFLFFVDNTPPLVRVLSPLPDETVNGIFAVAGSATDTVGLESVTWQAGDLSGSFELVPGNPYWVQELDFRGSTKKQVDFTVTARDTAGNEHSVRQRIPLDNKADLPVTAIRYPAQDGMISGSPESLYVQGIVTDDDGVAGIYYSVDGQPEMYSGCTGVFSIDISEQFRTLYPGAADDTYTLPAGTHRITVSAEDIHGVRGEPVTVSFVSQGEPPVLEQPVVVYGKGDVSEPYYAGCAVNPEAGGVFTVTVRSGSGLAAVDWTVNGQPAGSSEFTKSRLSETVHIPLDSSMPWGAVYVTVTARDVYGRETRQDNLLYLDNLTGIDGIPLVLFAEAGDSGGAVYFEPGTPVTGFFTAGTTTGTESAAAVTLVPETELVTASLDGDRVILTPGSTPGVTPPVKVQVTTSRGRTVESVPLVFTVPGAEPSVQLDNTGVADGSRTVVLSGRITAGAPVSAAYRIIPAVAEMENGMVTGAAAGAVLPDVPLELDDAGNFRVELEPAVFSNGVFVVEFTARCSTGETASAAAFVQKIPPLPELTADSKKAPAAARPVVVWLESENLYYTVVYQGTLETPQVSAGSVPAEGDFFPVAGIVPYSRLEPGKTPLTLTGTAGGKSFSSKYTVDRQEQPEIALNSINGVPYTAGMTVEVPADSGKNNGAVLAVTVRSTVKPDGVTWTVSPFGTGSGADGSGAESLSAGECIASGRAAVRSSGTPGIYEADIPLGVLPVQWNLVTLTASAGGADSEPVSGVFGVVRPKDSDTIDDLEQIYWLPAENGRVQGFFNAAAPFSLPELADGTVPAAPEITVDGRIITVTAPVDGVYEKMVFRLTDGNGFEQMTSPVSVTYASAPPSGTVQTPAAGDWVRDMLTVRGTASDATGISEVAVSIDGGLSWTPALLEKDVRQPETDTVYSLDIPLNLYGDGYIPVAVRITDGTGAQTLLHTAVAKDTQPPEITVIAPAAGDIVNGETRMIFKVTDGGLLASGSYIPPATMNGAAGISDTNTAGGGLDSDSAAGMPAGAGSETAGLSGDVRSGGTEGITGAAEDSRSVPLMALPSFFTGTGQAPLDAAMRFSFTDTAGNTAETGSWEFSIDAVSDLPRPEIHLPEEGQIITTDFVISGVIYDDDGPSRISWRIDDGEYHHSDVYDSSFSIPIPLDTMTDNEHTVTVYAEDIRGVRGQEVTRSFRISLEEPRGAVLEPGIDDTVNGLVVLSGNASDANGIEKVQVSLDNGNTYNDAEGTESWTYTFDSRVIEDGTHVVFLRIYDKYGIEGLYSSMINVDNTAPVINLELPLDGSETSGMLFFSGQTMDNIGLEELYLSIRSLDGSGNTVLPHLARVDFAPDQIITQILDISSLADGFYNVELTGVDAGGNTRRVSRNVSLNKNRANTKVDILYPLNGEHVQGVFNLYGTAVSDASVDKLMLYVDDTFVAEARLSETGYFRFDVSPDMITSGRHLVKVSALTSDMVIVDSAERYLFYEPAGPWITIDNFTMCDFAVNRPYLEGRAGYVFTDEELAAANSKETSKEAKALLAEKQVDRIELSFDNGKTFTETGKTGKWRYRIENDYLAEGYHFLIVRAVMKNGETAVTRSIIRIDKTAPSIDLISPGEGGFFNEEIIFSGLASDDIELSSVTLVLRSGDKSSYEVPAFIQGLYFDWHFWGATLYDVGIGLTFFDDNVKLQVQFGQFTQTQRDVFDKRGSNMRYGGNVFGAKLLANIAYIPFRYFFGPDWDWLSAGFALGANFSLFSQTQSGKPQMLSAVLAQVEFPRVTLKNQKLFRTFSLYTEGQLWFLPTDVQAGETNISSLIPQISAGIRVNVF